MAEYIEREAFAQSICENRGLTEDEANKFIRLLRSCSTTDVQKVKHGKWNKSKNQRECSLCGFFYFTNKINYNYCPNCGAKMDRRSKNDTK